MSARQKNQDIAVEMVNFILRCKNHDLINARDMLIAALKVLPKKGLKIEDVASPVSLLHVMGPVLPCLANLAETYADLTRLARHMAATKGSSPEVRLRRTDNLMQELIPDECSTVKPVFKTPEVPIADVASRKDSQGRSVPSLKASFLRWAP